MTRPGIEPGSPWWEASRLKPLSHRGPGRFQPSRLSTPRRTGFKPRPGYRIFACGNRAGRCHWSAGFLGDIQFPPALSFRRCYITTSITLTGSQDPKLLTFEQPIPSEAVTYVNITVKIPLADGITNCSRVDVVHPDKDLKCPFILPGCSAGALKYCNKESVLLAQCSVWLGGGWHSFFKPQFSLRWHLSGVLQQFYSGEPVSSGDISSAFWSFSCVFIGCCPTPGSYGIRKAFPCKSAIGSDVCRVGLIDCDPIAKYRYQMVVHTANFNLKRQRNDVTGKKKSWNAVCQSVLGQHAAQPIGNGTQHSVANKTLQGRLQSETAYKNIA
ncbi:hypothetical protein PR048_026371 [Dryococelus australis]|uniref:Uncharacterized protein n=1 Tax=Dryococelus australis TaxID=614101 RepID=A0ABQ9GL59_9NEOP|nr:hypothetical protein PR048_026371 [Dryococelus australis]